MLPFFNGGPEMIKNLADFTEEECQNYDQILCF